MIADAVTKKGSFWKNIDNDMIECCLCSHRCRISNGSLGICSMRKNIGGALYTFAYGKIIAGNIDPVEKKPLYHFLPGTNTYSIAAPGCNFSCSFCQNWSISQIRSDVDRSRGEKLTPLEVADNAEQSGCNSISYTYTEPAIFFEYASDIAAEGKKKGLKNIFVTNGFMTGEAAEKAACFLDAANIDLKFFSDASYKRLCNGRLGPVLDTIRRLKELGVWVEVTTLIIPDVNDSGKELDDIARFIAATGTDIPWHVNRFHPDYRYIKGDITPAETLKKAVEIGKTNGLKYVYPGNVNAYIDTFCEVCGASLIERRPSQVQNRFSEPGKCPKCGNITAGIWE